MKKLFLPILAMASLFTSNVNAQHRVCGSAEHYQEMLQNDPEFALRHEAIEQMTNYYVANPQTHSRVVKTIPVVVHVVYNTATQNVSDAQIQSQIDVLNKDYRKLNSDWTGTPSVFQGLVADCEIEFCLAKQDPNGAATTGIIRKSTTTTSFTTNDAVKKNSTGGDDAWTSSKYLNLWVCNLSGGVLGYAQFPGGPAATDGVVITYTGFGTMGTAATPFNLGRTATHEVGHWLNLYHIWGDDGTACTGSDQVSDTPNQGSENYGCPAFPHVSCSNGANGDLFMNYMDYTDDACMFMFSAGQKARMDALFTTGGARVSLLTSPGCTVPTGTSCGVPSNVVASAIATTGVTIGWTAVSGASSYNVQYKLANSTTWTTTTSTTTSKALTGLIAGTAYNAQVQAICAAGSSAYSSPISFTTTSTTGACSNNYESNNTTATATSITINSTISSMIGTSTDKDYYKIVTTSNAPKLKVTLSNLPGDYDLKLYNASGTLLGTSQNGGTTAETITYNSSTAGNTYYIYVYGYGGAYSTSVCYNLTTLTSASNLKTEENLSDITKPEIMLFPNPAGQKMTTQFFASEHQDVVFNIYNTVGAKIATQKVTTIEGQNETAFDLSSVANGMYILEMITNDERKVQKFTVQK